MGVNDGVFLAFVQKVLCGCRSLAGLEPAYEAIEKRTRH